MTIPSSTIRTTAYLLLLAMTAPAARAQTSALTVEQDGERTLRILDLATGALTTIGPIELPPGQFGPTAITYLPSGELVGVSSSCETLVSIDPETAVTTVIGDLGADPMPPLSNNVGLAADACGRLWMVCGLALYQVDVATGQAVLRGPLPVYILGLAAAGGLLYGFDSIAYPDNPHLMSLDPATLDLTTVAEVEGLVAWVTYSLDIDDAGELVTLGKVFPPIPIILPQETVHVSLSGEIVSPRVEVLYDGTVRGLALGPPAGECLGGALPIPTASGSGLAFLAVLIAAAGAILVSRRG